MRPFPRRILARALLASLLAISLRAASIQSEPFAGVRYTHRVQTVPRLLSIHIVEIDLTHPAIRFLVTPSNGDAAGENTPRVVSQFVTGVGAQIGVNATFFTSAGGGGFNNVGLVASQGDVYSPFESGNSAAPVLHVSAENFAQILRRVGAPNPGTSTAPAVPLYNAVSGNEKILTNGRETAGTAGDAILLHPRTAAGISSDRRLIFLVVDGRQAGFSLGMYNREQADLLMQYGAVEGVNLDGGGSSTLVFADPTARVLNRPSDGRERPVAASIAVFAAAAESRRDVFVYADFYGGDAEGFPRAFDPANAQGLLATSTVTTLASQRAVARGWHQRLTLRADPASAPAAQPAGLRWSLRHPWSAPADPASRPAAGSIGYWVRTAAPGARASLAVSAGGATWSAQPREIVADGNWHVVEWNLQDPSAWSDATGVARAPSGEFRLEAVQLFGTAEEAVVDLDLVAHTASGSLGATLAPPATGNLANLSVRASLPGGDTPLHLGMSLAAGTGERPMLLRAGGPALAAFGISAVAADPRLTLLDAQGRMVAQNDNWAGATPVAAAGARVGAFAFSPSSLDAAALAPLSSGSYVLQARHSSSFAGTVLVEAYDAGDGPGAPRLVNLSTRTVTGSEPLIAGFVVAGGPRRILVRAIGPTLATFGVRDALADPQLAVYAGSALHALNDDWGGGVVLTDVFARAGAFELPAASRDAAVLLNLAPGAYTVHVTSVTAASGSVLIELYEAP